MGIFDKSNHIVNTGINEQFFNVLSKWYCWRRWYAWLE